jgi:hypothetical protein
VEINPYVCDLLETPKIHWHEDPVVFKLKKKKSVIPKFIEEEALLFLFCFVSLFFLGLLARSNWLGCKIAAVGFEL